MNDRDKPVDSGKGFADGKNNNLIMLAISNLRCKESAIEYALDEATKYKELLILFINDQDFSNCCLGVGGWFVREGLLLSDDNELEKNERENIEKVTGIVKEAELRGIKTRTSFGRGNFSMRTLETASKFNPDVIITTRRWRYMWQRLIFGSHVDKIIDHAKCKVIEI